ncbi:MAG: hypothetical protein ACXWHF_00150 [Chthoniobacterales bacterium]
MKQLPILLKLSCAAAFICAAVSSQGQNIVADPGFEASADGIGAHPFSASWTVVDSSGFTNVGGDTIDAHSGVNYANLGATATTGSLSQLLTTMPGRLYTLSFFLTNNTILPTNFFQAFFNGSLVFATTSPPFTGSGAYIPETITGLLATGSSTLLEFRYQNDQDFWRLDDISVVAPEGGAPLWLAIPIFGGLCLLHSRFHRRQEASIS